MDDKTPQELNEAMTELANLTLDQGGLETLTQRVTTLAVSALPGCDYAGLSLATNGRVTTAAATNELVGKVDAAQYDTGEGPCLQAMRDGVIFRIPSMKDDERFPRWAPRAREAGVLSSLSVPLEVKGDTIGALNLYSRSEGGFRAEDEPLGRMLAGQAAVALLNGRVYEESVRLAEQLQAALETRTVISQATGILMEREGVSDEEAFLMLKKTSQRANIKLSIVAQKVVDDHLAAHRN